MKFSTTATALFFATLAVASPLGTPTKRDAMPCVPDDPTSCTNIGSSKKREPEPLPCVPDDPTSCGNGNLKREPEPEPEPVPVPCVVDDPTPCATSLSVA